MSFCLGAGLYGSVYLIPVFLGVVRGHNALEIGQIMLVTGVAQLAATPFALALDKRVSPLVLSAFGFLLFAIGLGMSAMQTVTTDFDAMFWPQVVRGVAVMFCLACADASRARRSARRDGSRRQCAFNLDAQSRRRHWHRADRHDPVWPHRRSCARAEGCVFSRAMPTPRARSGSIPVCSSKVRRCSAARRPSCGHWSRRRLSPRAQTKPGCSWRPARLPPLALGSILHRLVKVGVPPV